MKKLRICFILSLTILVVFALAGCFGGGGGFPGDPTDPGTSTPTETETPDNPETSTGTIQGTVYEAQEGGSNTPAKNALVSVADQGISTYTDSNGEFELEDVWAGERLVVVSYQGQKSSSYVTVEAGKTTVVTVEMPSSDISDGDNDDTETGVLRIVAHSFYEGDEWVGVNYIRVWEYGNYSQRWYNSWDEQGNEDQYQYQLNCYNAEKYKYYVVEVGWYNGDVEQNDTIYLYQDDQTEYIFHY